MFEFYIHIFSPVVPDGVFHLFTKFTDTLIRTTSGSESEHLTMRDYLYTDNDRSSPGRESSAIATVAPRPFVTILLR